MVVETLEPGRLAILFETRLEADPFHTGRSGKFTSRTVKWPSKKQLQRRLTVDLYGNVVVVQIV
jgi:hypothetical protein